eukprot:TRINITY_DN33535_c0_g2_i1.p2 TRINITY_DN33535_c0_g2~~TRINITY_DN33535_c0_g2_i1.p2  ORF type:complete len:630 (+),score=201.13 TRINITY_DN33535_c0_g2_i1:64-1953(+)
MAGGEDEDATVVPSCPPGEVGALFDEWLVLSAAPLAAAAPPLSPRLAGRSLSAVGGAAVATPAELRAALAGAPAPLALCLRRPAPAAPPVTVLSGFLGAGKTTLLNRALSEAQAGGLRVAVIVNDMAAVNVDVDLVGGAVAEGGREALVELSGGCICCTLRDDLAAGVAALARRRRFDCILVESTGISEPLPVARTFSVGAAPDGTPLRELARLDCLVTVADAGALAALAASRETLAAAGQGRDDEDSRPIGALVADQLECADVVLLNKCDVAAEGAPAAAAELVRFLNPTCLVYETVRCDLPAAKVLCTGLYDEQSYAGTAAWRAEQDQPHTPETDAYGIRSFVYTRVGEDARPFVVGRLLSALRSALPEGHPQHCSGPLRGVLRAKGWCAVLPDAGRRVSLSLSHSGVRLASDSRWRVDELHELRSAGARGRRARALLAAVEQEVARCEARGVWSEEHGDRRHELVFIGLAGEMDEQALCAALDSAAADDAEMARGALVGDLRFGAPATADGAPPQQVLLLQAEGAAAGERGSAVRALAAFAREQPPEQLRCVASTGRDPSGWLRQCGAPAPSPRPALALADQAGGRICWAAPAEHPLRPAAVGAFVARCRRGECARGPFPAQQPPD